MGARENEAATMAAAAWSSEPSTTSDSSSSLDDIAANLGTHPRTSHPLAEGPREGGPANAPRAARVGLTVAADRRGYTRRIIWFRAPWLSAAALARHTPQGLLAIRGQRAAALRSACSLASAAVCPIWLLTIKSNNGATLCRA